MGILCADIFGVPALGRGLMCLEETGNQEGKRFVLASAWRGWRPSRGEPRISGGISLTLYLNLFIAPLNKLTISYLFVGSHFNYSLEWVFSCYPGSPLTH